MKVCMIEEESPNNRRCSIPLAAKASQRSGAGLDNNGGESWKSSVKTLGVTYLLKKYSFCIYKLLKNSKRDS